MCRLKYKKDNKWKLVGRGVVNLIKSSKSSQVRVVFRQAPSSDAKVLLNVTLSKKLESLNIIEPSGICFVNQANPELPGEKKDDTFLFLLQFRNKDVRVEFEQKYNEHFSV